MRNTYRKRLSVTLVFLVLLMTLVTVSAQGGSTSVSCTIRFGSESETAEITPEITEKDGVKTATLTPIELTAANTGKTAEFLLDDLSAYASANGIDVVEIVTGMGATGGAGGTAAAQAVIMDDAGNIVFAADARGGQLRYDKKMDGTSVNGKYSVTGDKTTAIDYADIRLQYLLTVPESVGISGVSWSWELAYLTVEKTVPGVKYSAATGSGNQYVSNVVVVNIPVSGYYDTDFQAALTVSFELDGVTYRLRQSPTTMLARTVEELVNAYKSEAIYNSLKPQAKAYVDALYKLIPHETWTPVI